MNTQQKSIIGELLAGVDLAYCEEDLRELALCLRTATTYTEGLLALETEELRRKWLSAGPGDSEAVSDSTAVKPPEVDVIVLLPSPKQNSVVNALRASVPVLSERAAMSVVQAAPIVLAVAGPHTSNLIKTLRAADGNVELWPYSHAALSSIIHTSEVYQYFAALKPSSCKTTAEVILPDETNLHGLVEIPDIQTARAYEGQYVLLGHRSGVVPAGSICWAPSAGVLRIDEAPRVSRLLTGGISGASRSIGDQVMLRVLPQPAKPAEEYVVLQSFPAPSRKMQVIKALRAAVPDLSFVTCSTSWPKKCENSVGNHPSLLGLKEAKTIVESAPIILATAGPHTDELVRELREAGATVDVVPRVNSNHHLDHASEVYAHFAELALRSGGAS